MNSTDLQPLGSCPNTWLQTEFDQFTTLKRGKDLTQNQFREGPIPVAGSNGVIGHHDTANVKGPGVTVGRSGSVGRVTYYEKDFWAHNTALFVADFHGNDPRFASYFLTFLNLGRFRSGASVPTLDRNVFRKLPIVAPPVPEQQKIAAVLGLVQRAIEQQERLLVLTTELKKALLHQLFTYGLRQESQKQTELGPIPQSWEVARIEELVIRGILAKPLDGNHGNIHPKSDDFVPEGIPFIMASDLKNGGIDLSGCAHLRKEQADKLQNGLHPVPKTPS